MSFVTAVVSSAFAIVTTDGRARQGEAIVDENAIKSLRPRNNLIIAYTGVKEVCEEITQKNNIDYLNESMEDIVSKFVEIVNSERYSTIRLQFILAGQNSKGQYQLSTVSNHSTNLNLIPASVGDLKIAHSGSDLISDESIDFSEAYSIYRSDLQKFESINDVLNAQIKFTSAVADFDPSVNKNIQYIYF